MSTEININDRSALVEVLSREGDKVRIKIDGKKYDADVVMVEEGVYSCLLYTSPSPRDRTRSRMPSSA